MSIFDVVCFYDLDLDSMTFTCKLDPYSLKIYRMCELELLPMKIPTRILSNYFEHCGTDFWILKNIFNFIEFLFANP